MHHVLIVDEEEHLLSALERSLFPDRDDITILTATNGELGLEHLKNSRVDLLISDIKMPGKIDGFQLILRAKEVAPDARVIIITAFGSNRVQNFADRIGVTHYIEKPFNTSELRDAILEILDEKEGFQGVLSDLELTDIIQMLCLARRTALLHLKHRDHRGRIVFDNGDVVHAEFDDLLGEDAVYRMLALRQGDIFMQSDFQNDQRSIEISWQDLLFEGVRRADEERADASDLEDDSEADDDGPGTDVGMAGLASQVDQLLTEEDADDTPASAGSEAFFSDDELREIEFVADEVEGEPSEPALPFATLEEASQPPGLEDDDFRSPFQRESSGLSGGLTSPGIPVAGERDADVEEADLAAVPLVKLKQRLEAFAGDCPGLRQTAIVSTEDGLPVAAVGADAGAFDHESFAALSGEVLRAAQRCVSALDDDEFAEMHVALGNTYVLLRCIQGTPYHHVVLLDRTVSLGVGLVLMRRLERDLRTALEM